MLYSAPHLLRCIERSACYDNYKTTTFACCEACFSPMFEFNHRAMQSEHKTAWTNVGFLKTTHSFGQITFVVYVLIPYSIEMTSALPRSALVHALPFTPNVVHTLNTDKKNWKNKTKKTSSLISCNHANLWHWHTSRYSKVNSSVFFLMQQSLTAITVTGASVAQSCELFVPTSDWVATRE